MKKRKNTIAKIRSRQSKANLKYGIQIPSTETEAIELDKANGNNLWYKAIQKEKTTVLIAFQILNEDEPLPVGYKKDRIPFGI